MVLRHASPLSLGWVRVFLPSGLAEICPTGIVVQKLSGSRYILTHRGSVQGHRASPALAGPSWKSSNAKVSRGIWLPATALACGELRIQCRRTLQARSQPADRRLRSRGGRVGILSSWKATLQMLRLLAVRGHRCRRGVCTLEQAGCGSRVRTLADARHRYWNCVVEQPSGCPCYAMSSGWRSGRHCGQRWGHWRFDWYRYLAAGWVDLISSHQEHFPRRLSCADACACQRQCLHGPLPRPRRSWTRSASTLHSCLPFGHETSVICFDQSCNHFERCLERYFDEEKQGHAWFSNKGPRE